MMKRSVYFVAVSYILFFLCVELAQAHVGQQDHTQWSLPDGAIARLGKGWVSGNPAFSPDGSVVAVPTTIGIWLYDAHTRKEMALLIPQHEDSTLRSRALAVECASFSPDGKVLASGGHGETVKLWSVQDGQQVASLEGHIDKVSCVSFAPDGRILATGSWDGTVKLWAIPDGQEITTLRGHTERITTISFSPDGGTLASGSRDRTVRLWSVSRREEIAKPGMHGASIDSVSYSPDGQVLATSAVVVRLWSVPGGQELAMLEGYSPNFVSFSPDGQILAVGSNDKTVKLWSVTRREEVAALEGHTESVLSVCFSPDGKILASRSWDHTVKLWSVENGQEIATIRGHNGIIQSISFSPDGEMLASGGYDKRVVLWSVPDRREMDTLEGHAGPVFSVSFSPDGEMVASASHDGAIRLWSVRRREEIAAPMGKWTNSVSFSPDGKILASASDDKTVRLWSVPGGQEIATLEGHSSYVRCVSFSPDGEILASGGDDKTVKLWSVPDRREMDTLEGHTGPVLSVLFSPDGKLLAGNVNGTVRIWSVASRQEFGSLMGHTLSASSISFSPDGEILARGHIDGIVKLWAVATGEGVAAFRDRPVGVHSVYFSPSGGVLASGNWDGTILLWDLKQIKDKSQSRIYADLLEITESQARAKPKRREPEKAIVRPVSPEETTRMKTEVQPKGVSRIPKSVPIVTTVQPVRVEVIQVMPRPITAAPVRALGVVTVSVLPPLVDLSVSQTAPDDKVIEQYQQASLLGKQAVKATESGSPDPEIPREAATEYWKVYELAKPLGEASDENKAFVAASLYNSGYLLYGAGERLPHGRDGQQRRVEYYREAMKCFEHFVTNFPDHENYSAAMEYLGLGTFEVARLTADLDAFARAAEHFLRFAGEFPEHGDAAMAQFQAGELYFAAGGGYCANAYEATDPDVKEKELEASVSAYEKAASAYSGVVDQFPGSEYAPVALNALASSYIYISDNLTDKVREKGYRDKAVVVYRELVDKYPQSQYAASALLAMGNVYFNQSLASDLSTDQKTDLYKKSLDAYKQALQVPGTEGKEEKKADTYIRETEELLAKEIYDAGSVLVAYDLSVETRKANAPKSILYFQEVIDTAPNTEYADLSFVQLGICYEYLEQWEEVEDSYAKLIEKYTDQDGKPITPSSEKAVQAVLFARQRKEKIAAYRLYIEDRKKQRK